MTLKLTNTSLLRSVGDSQLNVGSLGGPAMLAFGFTGKGDLPMHGIAVVLAAGIVSLGGTTLKVRVGTGPGHMDERGPTVWLVDGKKIHIDRTYFQAEGKELAFVVEWRCAECRPRKPISQEEALAVSRAVLWYAVESGEANRTVVSKVGSGKMRTTHLRSVIAYQVRGESQQTSVSINSLDSLFDWTWILGGRSYRVFGPGYYFDTDARQLYFTIKWHDRTLCDPLTGITDERAATLAMPLMKHIASRKLFKHVPRVGPTDNNAEIDSQEVDAIGIEIGCPDPACAGAVDCPAKGYRVSRTLRQISVAP
jgi:hypothetical protein